MTNPAKTKNAKREVYLNDIFGRHYLAQVDRAAANGRVPDAGHTVSLR